MNKKINSAIFFSAIASILFLLIVFVTDLVAALDQPHIYVIKREQAIWEIFSILPYVLFTIWAVSSHKKVFAVLGSLALLISNFYFLIYPYRMGVGYSNIIVAYAAPCASIVLLIAAVLKKRSKFLFVISLVALAVLDLLEIITMIRSMLTIVFFNMTWVIRGIANGFSIIFYIALCTYVVLDCMPFEKKTALRKEYIRQKKTVATSLADQLNLLKNDYEAGKISADEYKTRRIEVLRSNNK